MTGAWAKSLWVGALVAFSAPAWATDECEYWSSAGLPRGNYDILGYYELPAYEKARVIEAYRDRFGELREHVVLVGSETGGKTRLAKLENEDLTTFIVGDFRGDLYVYEQVDSEAYVARPMRALRTYDDPFMSDVSLVVRYTTPIACKVVPRRGTLIHDRRRDDDGWWPRESPPAVDPEGLSKSLEGLGDGEAKPSEDGGLGGALGETLKPDRSDSTGSLTDVVPKRAPSPPAVPSTRPPASPRSLPSEDAAKDDVDSAVLDALRDPPRVCDAITAEPLDIELPDDLTTPIAAGRLASRGPFEAFQRLDVAPDILFPFESALRINNMLPGDFVRLSLPYGRAGHSVSGREDDLQSVAIPSARLSTAEAEPEPVVATEAPEALRFVVIGDPRVLKRAALSELDRSLASFFDASLWGLEWIAVQENGQLDAPIDVTDFATLEALVDTKSGEFFVSGTDSLTRLLDGIRSFVTETPRQVDMVILLLEGQRVLPPETPALMDNFLRDVATTGNIPRRGRGDAYPWLTLVSGYTDVTYNLAYLEGPVKDRRSGSFIAESRSRGTGVVPLDPDSEIVTELRKPLARLTSGSSTTVPAPGRADTGLPEGLYLFDRRKVLSEMGVVLPVDQLDALRNDLPRPSSESTGEPVVGPEARTVLNARTDDSGVLRGALRRDDNSEAFLNTALRVSKSLGTRSYGDCAFVYVILEDSDAP